MNGAGDPAPGPLAGAEQWVALGERELRTGRLGEATAAFRRATELQPAVASHWLHLGRIEAARSRLAAAEAALRRACALQPDAAAPHLALADLLVQENRAQEALEACDRALAAEPDDLAAAVAEALLLPPIYADNNDLEAWRVRFADGLERLGARLSRWLERPEGVLAVEATNFYLAYQGKDDLALQTAYGDFLAALLGRAVPQLQAPISPRHERRGRIRLGIVSSNLRVSTVGDYFGAWITDLPRDRFEVVAVLCAGIPDVRTEQLARACDRFVAAHGSARDIALTLRSLELDILVFLDVGMTPWGGVLSNLRLAPVQCAAWGHPVTTGSAFIDRFFSCGEMEPRDADRHYREKLVLLPGLGTHYRPPPRVVRARREDFALPASGPIYLCPHALFKIHPDADALFLELLRRDRDATLVFVAATTAGQRQAFVQRLERGMRERDLEQRQQIKLLPLLSHRDFRRLMTVADVMLDTPHWSGGSTSLDALGASLPIVTLEGKFMRGRQSAAMLRIVGVPELVASDEAAYVELALRVAGDRAYRDALASRIGEGWPRLVNRSEPIETLATALAAMIDAGR